MKKQIEETELASQTLKLRITIKEFFTFWAWPSVYSDFKTRMYHRVTIICPNNQNLTDLGQAHDLEKDRLEVLNQEPNGARKN